MNKTEKFMVHFILIYVILTSIFSDRIILKFSTGGNGVVQISTLLSPLIALGIFLLTKGGSISFFRKTKFLVYFFPYIIFTLILPFMGVLFMGYPLRTVFLSVKAINILALIMLGYWFGAKSSKQKQIFKYLQRYLFLSILLQFLYSLCQFLFRNSLIGSIWLPFYNWDIESQLNNGLELIYGRSTGFYLNPNVLGLWAVLSIWISILLFKTKRIKLLGISTSVVVLVLSQSRGAMVAFILSLMLTSIFKLFSTGKITHPLKIILSIVVLIPLYSYLINSGMIEDTLQTRFTSALNIFSSGVSADTNFSDRVSAWNEAFDMLGNYPLGTFGSPEFLFGGYIDNDWVRLLLQGGVFYPITFLLLIIGSLTLRKASEYSAFLAISAFAIGICAITQIPLAYAPMNIFWFILGIVSFGNKKNTEMVSKKLSA